MKKQERKITVSDQYQRRTWHYVSVPEIRLAGLWLQEAGFKKGQKVKIEVKNKQLTITACPKQKTPSNKR